MLFRSGGVGDAVEWVGVLAVGVCVVGVEHGGEWLWHASLSYHYAQFMWFHDPARREVKYGKASRVDFLLEKAGSPRCFVEVKNVHLKRNGRAEFPDSVTARGAKHMAELADQVTAGDRAVVLFVVQRDDCDSFAPAADIDPAYAAAFRAARAHGVEALCYGCKVSPDAIQLDRALAVEP